jgi:hypothetical protein
MSIASRAAVASLVALALLETSSNARAWDTCVQTATCNLGEHVPLAYPGGLQVTNIYWDQNWDGEPAHAGFSINAIDTATRALINSGYFNNLQQYGVQGVGFAGSTNTNTPLSPCQRRANATENLGTFAVFLTCEEAAGALANVPNQVAVPSPSCGVCGSLPGSACLADPGCLASPNTTGKYIYNVFLPKGTTMVDAGGQFVSCRDYASFHAQVPSMPIGGWFTNIAGGRPLYFTVIPLDCVSSLPQLMLNVSHELAEAATDPLPLTSWFDPSAAASTTSSLDVILENLAKEAEAADICQGLSTTVTPSDGSTPFQAAAYWSNVNRSCWALTNESPPCTHNECTTGGSLNTTCGSCAADLCSVDPWCCTTSWDSICIGEVASVCHSLTCPGDDACAHPECSTGAFLSSTCSSCATSVCSHDAYCCNTMWDGICVSEVPSYCPDTCSP